MSISSFSIDSFFIENKGQWPDNILFLTQTNGLNTWITKQGMIYDIYSLKESDNKINKIGHVVGFKNENQNSEEKISYETGYQEEGYFNFFIGKDNKKWASNVKLFKEVTIKNIYSGIDMRYYYQNENLRYDYIIHPNANPNQIQVTIDGAINYFINAQGELVFYTRFGELKQTQLFTYQFINGKKKEIRSSFKLVGNSIQFDLGDYDKSKPLIIDPLIWSSFIGGGGNDRAYTVVEKNGNAYISGWCSKFLGADFPTTPGAYDTTYNSTEAFVSKFNNNGSSLVYSTFIGPVSNSGGGNVHADGVFLSVDSSGNAYITGIADGTYPTTPGVFDTTTTNGVFVTKLNSTGSVLLYSTFIGNGNPRAITTDDKGYAYITGSALSGFPTTVGAYDVSNNGSFDAFVTKLDTNASSLIFSTYIGGSGNYEDGFDIITDTSYNVYITGRTSSSNFPTTLGCYDNTFNGGSGPFPYDAFIAKLNSSGSSLLFSTFIGGTDNDEAYGLDIDNNNNVYITGYTESPDFPITTGAYDTTNNSSDAFILKLNNTGSNLSYSTFFGNGGSQEGLAIALDQNNNVWFCGTTTGTMPITSDAFDNIMDEGFFAGLNLSSSTLLYCSYVGGTTTGAVNVPKSVDTDLMGGIYLAGWTGATDFPITTGAFQTTNASFTGYNDAFLLKFQHETTTGIIDFIESYEMLIYPNPAVEIVTIENLPIGSTVNITDLSGKVVYTFVTQSELTTINTTEFVNGVYIIQANCNGSTVTKKLIVNK